MELAYLLDTLHKTAGWDLTERELEVLELLATGKTNDQIMNELCITRNTLKTHTSHIYSKLDVQDRTQAALWAFQNGFAD